MNFFASSFFLELTLREDTDIKYLVIRKTSVVRKSEILQELENRLVESKIELAFWLKIAVSTDGADSMELGFDKLGKRWRMVLRSPTTKERSSVVKSAKRLFPVALFRVSSDLRTKAFCAMPEFLRQFR